MLGYPLARTQDDLTEMQRAFLLKALPPAIQRMQGSGDGVSANEAGPQRGPAKDLFRQMQSRQKGKRK